MTTKHSARKTVVALYGNVKILSGYCNDCQRTAFVLDGYIQCCDAPFDDEPVGYKRAIEAEGRRRLPPIAFRQAQLKEQNHRCFYCERSFGSLVFRRGKPVRLQLQWDHMTPFAYGQDNHSYNFVAACHVCNRIKSSRIFQTLTEARIYIDERWREKGYWFQGF